jgi:hypothetical protein
MNTIQNAARSESHLVSVSPTGVSNTGAVKNSIESHSVQMNAFSSRAAQLEGGVPENVAAKPPLRAPRTEGPAGADFDIMAINTKSADLLIGFLLLMLQARAVEAKFNSAMVLKNADAVAGAVKAIKDGGWTTMVTGVIAGCSSVALAGFGAASKAIGASKSRLNDKNVVRPMQARQEDTAKLTNTLNSAKAVKADNEIKALNVVSEHGNNKTVPLAPNDTALSAANHAKIAETIKANEVLNRADLLANDANQKTISKWNVTGDLFMAGGALGGVVSAGGQLDIAVKRAEEKTGGLQEKVADLGATKARETAKTLAGIIDELARAMMTIFQTQASTASSIIDRTRA